MNPELRLSLRFPADWDRIEFVRKAVCYSADAVFADERFKDAIGMVASELLENAVKYGRPEAPIEVSVTQSADIVTVVVTNEADPTTANVESLRKRLAWLKTFADPREAYTATLLAADEESSDGGLGLVRVAHEGRASLECELSAGTVKVSARCAPPPWSAAGLGAE